jgi:hypothetical protein
MRWKPFGSTWIRKRRTGLPGGPAVRTGRDLAAIKVELGIAVGVVDHDAAALAARAALSGWRGKAAPVWRRGAGGGTAEMFAVAVDQAFQRCDFRPIRGRNRGVLGPEMHV